jgi:hypothetical protein
MSDPLKPHEVIAHAALVVADPEAEMRNALRKMISDIVQEEIAAYWHPANVNASLTASNIIRDQKYTIGQIALSAVKNHFNNPTQISNY